MDRGPQFPEENKKCDECGETLEPGVSSHIHLSPEDVDFYRQLAHGAFLQAQMDNHMATAPADLNDHAALSAHLMSAAHWIDVNENHSLEALQSIHDADHEEYEIPHTTNGGSHFHHEEE